MKYPKLSGIKVLSEKEMIIIKAGLGAVCECCGCKPACFQGCTSGNKNPDSKY